MQRMQIVFGWLAIATLAAAAFCAELSPAPLAKFTATTLKTSSEPDTELIAILEKYGSDTEFAEGSEPVSAALAVTKTDAVTLLKLFDPLSQRPEFNAITIAVIEASARRAAEEVEKKPELVEPILLAIDKVQPAMNKFAWRGGGNLKPYADLLGVYVDNCPSDHPILGKRLADVQMRHITAARFGLSPADTLKRLNAIDATKLSREKDRDQLDYLLMENAAADNRMADAGKYAQAMWAKPTHQFRDRAWMVLFESLIAQGKKAEATALLDEMAKDPKYAVVVNEYRARLAATQPANP